MIPKDASALVEFVAPQPVLKELAEDLLSPVLLLNGSVPYWFKFAVERGILQVAQINYDGQPLAIVWYRLDGSKLIIEMIKSISKVPPLGKTWYSDPAFTRAFERLAKANNCKSLEARTRRKAVIKSLAEIGWIPESINILKQLE